MGHRVSNPASCQANLAYRTLAGIVGRLKFARLQRQNPQAIDNDIRRDLFLKLSEQKPNALHLNTGPEKGLTA